MKLFMFEKPAAAGPKHGTILFVHGSSMASQACFDLQIPGLPDASVMDFFARRGFDTWTFDCRGYGRSDKTDDILATISEGSDDIAVVADYIAAARQAGPLLIYGASAGALRAALFASRHPRQVKRVALDGFVWTGNNSPTLAQRRKRLPEFHASSRRPLSREFLGTIFTRDHAGTVKEELVEPFKDAVLAIEDSVPNGTYIDMCENLPVVDPAQLTVPTLIMRGEYDGIASFDDLIEFFKRLPNPDREFAVLPGCAHASMMCKDYARVYDVLLTFFLRPPQVYFGG